MSDAFNTPATVDPRLLEMLVCPVTRGRLTWDRTTNELISKGADVFFGDASAVDSGAREAIDAANEKAGAIKVFDIGQPADILGQNPCIICSQVTDNSAMIVASMQAVQDGNFGGETIFGTLQNNTLSAGKISELVPAEVQEKYNAYLQQMIDGTFMK